MRNNVRGHPTNQGKHQEEHDRRDRSPLDRAKHPLIQARVTNAGPKSDTTCDQPQHRPVEGSKVVTAHNLKDHQCNDREETNDIRRHTVERFSHPEQDRQKRNDIEDLRVSRHIKRGRHINVELRILGNVAPRNKQPRDRQNNQHQRNSGDHPVKERHGNTRSLQCAQGDCIRGRTDRRSHTAHVGGDGDRQCNACSCLTFGQRHDDRHHDREHRGGRCRIRHEHTHQSGNEHDAHDRQAWFAQEWLQQDS